MEKEKETNKALGEYSVTFKAGKPQEGDVVIRTKRRTKPKGQTINGAAKMKAAYRARVAKKSAKRR
ncbi:MAG: hypothetical protein R3Y26_11780 [Rikenellaceae bacterium]